MGFETALAVYGMVELLQEMGEKEVRKSFKKAGYKKLDKETEEIIKGAKEIIRDMRKVIWCSGCGCTDKHPCKGGCTWIEPGLCSKCADEPKPF